jgi:hypothetical protein
VWGRWPHFATEKFAENLLAMLLFGLIVAFFAQRSGADHARRGGKMPRPSDRGI